MELLKDLLSYQTSIKCGTILEDLKSDLVSSLEIDSLGVMESYINDFIQTINQNVVGQQEAKNLLINSLLPNVLSKFPNNKGCLWAGMFVGPSGVGKTQLVETIAQTLLGDISYIVKIYGEAYQKSHEDAKLLGSPPGYIGYGNKCIFSKQNLNNGFEIAKKKGTLSPLVSHRNGLSIILVDEVEKMHPNIWNIFLNIINSGFIEINSEKGNEIADFRNSIIIFTSNAGTKKYNKEKLGTQIGFGKESFNHDITKDLYQRELKKIFSPEFLGRINKNIVVFNELTKQELKQIIEINRIFLQKLISTKFPLIEIVIEDSLINKLIADGYSLEYGARDLNHVINTLLYNKLVSIMHAGRFEQIDFGANVHFSYDQNRGVVATLSKQSFTQLLDTFQDINSGGKFGNTNLNIDLIDKINSSGSILETLDEVYVLLNTYTSLLENRELLNDDFHEEILDIEESLLAMGFSKTEIVFMRSKSFINHVNNNYSFISDYSGLNLDMEEFDRVFKGFSFKAIRSYVYRKVKQMGKDSDLLNMISQIEEHICFLINQDTLTMLQRQKIGFLIKQACEIL